MDFPGGCISIQFTYTLHMKNNPAFRTIVILAIIFLITYAIADGIRYGSTWGVVMALLSMIAFVFSIKLARRLKALQEEEEQQA